MIRYPSPPEVFLDTSVVISALYPGTSGFEAAADYCSLLSASRTTVYFSEVLRIELGRGFRRLATKPDRLPADVRATYDLDRWGDNSLIRQRWLSNGVRRFNEFLLQFARVVELPMNSAIWLESIDVMAADGLDATDALHIATARAAGIPDFATADADFRRVVTPRIQLIREEPAD